MRGAWRESLSRQAIVVETMGAEAPGAWRYLFPASWSRSVLRLLTQEQRQAIM